MVDTPNSTPSAKYQYRNGIKADVVLQAKVLWLRR